MCRARLDALNPPKLVKRRITGKKAPEYAEVACRVEPVVARPKKKQKRGGTMAKSDTVRRVKKRAAPDGRSFECECCGGSFSAEKHVYSCEKAPWTEWAKGVRWRADLRNKTFHSQGDGHMAAQMRHCQVVFPCEVRFDETCKRVQEEESERRVVVVTGFLCCVKDDCLPFSCLFGDLCCLST